MISYVKGPLMAVEEDMIVVEAGSLGLGIHVPLSVLEALPPLGNQVTVYTHFQVREDAMTLYGFLHRQDREMFRQLIGVNGIGPKAALGILSVLRLDELRLAVISGDAKAISRAPGVGTKTAQRIILDLKDKVSAEEILENMTSGAFEAPGAAQAGAGMAATASEAVQALVALGYSSAEAARAVKKTEVTEDMSAEDILRASLKHLSFL